IADIVLCIEEACSNAIRHSGAADDGMRIALRFDGDDLIAEVRDHGRGFDVGSCDPGRMPDPLAPGGRGLYLMGQLTDDLQLRCEGGLEVRLVKRGVLARESTDAERRLLGSIGSSTQLYREERRRA